MKKIFLFIVIAFAAIGVNAQKTTYIAKVGGGIGGKEFKAHYSLGVGGRGLCVGEAEKQSR